MSAAAAHLLSKAGELISKRRSGLKPANVNMLLFLNKNLYVTGSEKRRHFVQTPNFGFKMLITLKL